MVFWERTLFKLCEKKTHSTPNLFSQFSSWLSPAQTQSKNTFQLQPITSCIYCNFVAFPIDHKKGALILCNIYFVGHSAQEAQWWWPTTTIYSPACELLLIMQICPSYISEWVDLIHDWRFTLSETSIRNSTVKQLSGTVGPKCVSKKKIKFKFKK